MRGLACPFCREYVSGLTVGTFSINYAQHLMDAHGYERGPAVDTALAAGRAIA